MRRDGRIVHLHYGPAASLLLQSLRVDGNSTGVLMEMIGPGSASMRASSPEGARGSQQGVPAESRLGRVLLDLLDEAVMVLDVRGRVAYQNAAAQGLLASDVGLAPVRGIDREWRLCNAAVLDAIRQVTGFGGHVGCRQRTVVIPSPDCGARLVLHVQPCPPTRNLSGPHAVVRIHDPLAAGDGGLEAGVLRESFELTAVEAEVALALAQGLSPTEISQRRGVSRTTTAFHLRNLFAKTGTRRQPELVRVLLAHAVAGSPSRG